MGLLYPLRRPVHFGGDRGVRSPPPLRFYVNLPGQPGFAGADRDTVLHSAFVRVGAIVADSDPQTALGVQTAGYCWAGYGQIRSLDPFGDGRSVGGGESGLRERALIGRGARAHVHHFGNELQKGDHDGHTKSDDGEETQGRPR